MRIVLLFLQLYGSYAIAASPSPTPGNLLQDPNGFLIFNHKPGDEVETYRMLDEQNKVQDAGSRNPIAIQGNITSGQARAMQMIEILKDQEMQKALKKVTLQGKQMLQESPEMRNPVTIIAGAFSLWTGRTLKLIRGENFKLATRLEARSRSGDFSMESPILNGKLAFSSSDGFTLSLNRSIASTGTTAAMVYSAKQQMFTGQLTHPLTGNIGLSFGAVQTPQSNQTDGQAKLEYRLSF